MQNKTADQDITRLLRTAAWLWVGYLLAMLFIDRLFLRPAQPMLIYYMVNSCTALIFLALAYWDGVRSGLKNVYLPLMMILCTVFPMVISHLLPTGPNAPASNPESMALRQLPMLFMALVIIAWQYGLAGVLIFSTATALLELITVDVLSPLYFYIFRINPQHPLRFSPTPFQNINVFLFLNLVRTISFIVVGVFISQLITRLHAQQRSLAEANTRLSHYASTLESLTISRERNHMAHELHDTLAHSLTAISVQLETVKAYWSVDRRKARALLENSLDATRSGLEETRRALKSLRATPLEELGLVLALGQLIDSATGRGSLQITREMPREVTNLSPDVEQCIYRTTQESLENILRHSGARQVKVSLCQDSQNTTLYIQDDGRGFDPVEAGQAGHFGLLGMRERARMTGGVLTVSSQPGEGSTIRLVFGAAI